jgi:hypothetical protein
MVDGGVAACVGCCACTAILLIVILVPLSFSYVEYYEYGLAKRKSTGKVDTDEVYSRGRYALGPDHTFLKYQADSHYEELNALSVFSAGSTNSSIGLHFKVDVDFTFFLIEEEVGDLHRELAKSYRTVVVSRAKDAIKNEAVFVTFEEYFQNRMEVEKRFREAVSARWSAPPSLHVTLDQFHLGRIQIPDSVAQKQLEAKIQVERNDKESYLQQAQIERELTAVEVNKIQLEQNKVLQTAEAEANLIRNKAKVEAQQVQSDAQIVGTQNLYETLGITSQEHKTAFTYIRTLSNRANVTIDLMYLPPTQITPVVEVGDGV